jgi:hypothetical protein
MLTGKLGLILMLELTLAFRSIRGARQTGGSSALNPQEQATPQATLVLKEGTRVQLRLAGTLDSERGAQTSEGKRHSRAVWTGNIEGIEFGVFPEVRVDELVVIERGADAWGSAELKQKASFGRNGSVRVTPLKARAITGAEIPLRGNATQEGWSFCFAEGCLLTLFRAGDDAYMPIGTKVEAYVAKDIWLDTAAVKKAMAEAEQRKALERAARGDKAIVYIYRMSYDVDKSDVWHIAAAIRDEAGLRAFSEPSSVSLDGWELVRIPEYECAALTVTQGKHAIGADKSSIELDLIRGEDYYLRISGGSKKQLRLVSSNEAEEFIDPLRPGCETLSEPSEP